MKISRTLIYCMVSSKFFILFCKAQMETIREHLYFCLQITADEKKSQIFALFGFWGTICFDISINFLSFIFFNVVFSQ